MLGDDKIVMLEEGDAMSTAVSDIWLIPGLDMSLPPVEPPIMKYDGFFNIYMDPNSGIDDHISCVEVKQDGDKLHIHSPHEPYDEGVHM